MCHSQRTRKDVTHSTNQRPGKGDEIDIQTLDTMTTAGLSAAKDSYKNYKIHLKNNQKDTNIDYKNKDYKNSFGYDIRMCHTHSFICVTCLY